MTALLKHILAAGVGPALFGLGVTIIAVLIAARITGKMHLLRKSPIMAACLIAVLYLFAGTSSTKPPPVDPPDPPEPIEVFTGKVWVDGDGRLLLIDTPIGEVIP